MFCHIKQLCSLFCLFLSSAAFAEIMPSYIFTSERFPVLSSQSQNEDTVIYDLSAPQKQLIRMFGKQPNNPAIAEKEARSFMASDAFKEKDEQLRKSYEGLLKAKEWGIEKIPAVVIDSYVVYGTTSVVQAQQLIQQYQAIEAHHENK